MRPMAMCFHRCPTLLVSVLALCVVVGRGWSDEQQPPVHAGAGYTIAYPAGWEIHERMMGTDSLALSPQEGATDIFRENINVVVEELPAGITAKEYLGLTEQTMKSVFGEQSILGLTERTVRGRTVTVMEYRGTMGERMLHNNAHLLIVGSRAYIVTCAMLDGASRQAYLEALTGIADTLEIIDVGPEQNLP